MKNASESIHVPSLIPGGLVAAIVAGIAVFVANWNGSFHPGFTALDRPLLTISNAVFAMVVAVCWQFSGTMFGVHSLPPRSYFAGFWRALLSSAFITLLFGIYLSTMVSHPPLGAALGLFLSCALLIEGARLTVDTVFNSHPNRVVIVGSGRLATKAWRELRTRRGREMELVGFVDSLPDTGLMPDIATRYLGQVCALPRLVLELSIDDVIVATALNTAPPGTSESISLAGAMGSRILCLKDVCGIRPGSITGDYADAFFELGPAPRLHGLGQAIQRTLDVFMAAACLIACVPLLVLAGAFGLIGGPRLEFISETRLGFRRRLFKTYRVNPEVMHYRFGSFLAHAPLLWNVLRGDMSLVGPPPITMKEVAECTIVALSGRFNMRPGLATNLHLPRTISKWILDTGGEPGFSWSIRSNMRVLASRLFRTRARRTEVADTTAGVL
jgi:hypothetical protein